MKNRCEVTLENQGRSSITSGFVARELQDGFSVLVWAEEYYPRPRRIGFTKKPYSWKNFAQLLSRPNPFMEFYDEEVKEKIIVKGEIGLRADCLRMACCNETRILNYLLMQSEQSIDLLQSIFNPINCIEDYSFISELSECSEGREDTIDVFTLINHFKLKPDIQSFIQLKNLLDDEKSSRREEKELKRVCAIEPFSNQIKVISEKFDDEERQVRGGGMTRLMRSKRQNVKYWLEEYVVKHGCMPEGAHKVKTHFFNSSKDVEIIDFSE